MAILYQTTLHRVKCQECSQIFFVHVGDINRRRTRRHTSVPAQCPNCQHLAYVSRTMASIPAHLKPDPQDCCPSELLYDDLPVMEQHIDALQRQCAILRNHLAALGMHARNAYKKWDQHYHRAFMPIEFRNIYHVLQEIDQLLPSIYDR